MPIKVMKENRLENKMGIFDKLKNTAQKAVVSAARDLNTYGILNAGKLVFFESGIKQLVEELN